MISPRISVCVTTRNRAHLLPRLVAALEGQTLDADALEVVVHDDGSTDGSARVLAELADSSRLRISVLRSVTGAGAAAGRNKAWRAASAPFIAFTDDDCQPQPSWLEAALLLAEQGNDVVVGVVIPDPLQVHRMTPFSHTWEIRRSGMRLYSTSNVVYARTALEAVGGFDERYRGAAGEDTDLGFRIAMSCEPAFADAAVVLHDVRLGTIREKVRDQRRWSDITLVFATHPEARAMLLHRGLFWRRSHLDLLALVAAGVLAPWMSPAAGLALPWVHRKLESRGEEPWASAVQALPGLLAVDLAELAAMVRGSLRHRTLVL